MSWSQLSQPISQIPWLLTTKVLPHRSCWIPPPMSHVSVFMPRYSHRDIGRVLPDCCTDPPSWVYATYHHQITTIGILLFSCSGVYHMVAVVSARTIPLLSPTLWCWHKFEVSTIAPLSFITFLLIYCGPLFEWIFYCFSFQLSAHCHIFQQFTHILPLVEYSIRKKWPHGFLAKFLSMLLSYSIQQLKVSENYDYLWSSPILYLR